MCESLYVTAPGRPSPNKKHSAAGNSRPRVVAAHKASPRAVLDFFWTMGQFFFFLLAGHALAGLDTAAAAKGPKTPRTGKSAKTAKSAAGHSHNHRASHNLRADAPSDLFAGAGGVPSKPHPSHTDPPPATQTSMRPPQPDFNPQPRTLQATQYTDSTKIGRAS